MENLIFCVMYVGRCKKQPLTDNRCPEKFSKFYRKTTVLNSFFNKVVHLQPTIFLKKSTLLWVIDYNIYVNISIFS